MTKKKHISVALAVFNEAPNLARCLDSVKDFADEIIVVDGGSTDDTVKIAKKYNAHIIKTDNPPIFHINKQKAIEAAHGKWILQMDADEEITQELAAEITRITHEKQSDAGYYIARNNYFVGHRMRKGGTFPDYVIRLFKNGSGYFPCKSVHEQIVINGSVGYLEEPMNHYPYPSFAEYKRKADTYTSLTAQELKKQNVSISLYSHFKYNIIKPLYTFFNLYMRHRGFQDGWWGVIWAWYSGRHYAQAYKKYVQKQGKGSSFSFIRVIVMMFVSGIIAALILVGVWVSIPRLTPASTAGMQTYAATDYISNHIPGYRVPFYIHGLLSDAYFNQAEHAYASNDLTGFELSLERSHYHYTQALLYLMDIRNNGDPYREHRLWLKKIGTRHTEYIEPLFEHGPDISLEESRYFSATLFKVGVVRGFADRIK